MTLRNLLAVALLLVTSTALAGNQVIDLNAGARYFDTVRAKEHETVLVVVTGGDSTLEITCGIQDTDGDYVATARGDGCYLTFEAPYTGKYKLTILNRASTPARMVVITP